jgi:hypothetical protein
MAEHAGADRIPGKLIALRDGCPVGVVCLVETDMPGYRLGWQVIGAGHYEGIDVSIMRTSLIREPGR